MNTIFIGIAGGTGSGRTTLTEHLKQHFGDDISVVHHDSYYKYQDRPFEERCKQNYDHPDAFATRSRRRKSPLWTMSSPRTSPSSTL